MTAYTTTELIERLRSHMGKADMGEVLADCRVAATMLEGLSEHATILTHRLVEAQREIARLGVSHS